MKSPDSEKPGFSVPIRAQIGKSGKSKARHASSESHLSIVKSSDERAVFEREHPKQERGHRAEDFSGYGFETQASCQRVDPADTGGPSGPCPPGRAIGRSGARERLPERPADLCGQGHGFCAPERLRRGPQILSPCLGDGQRPPAGVDQSWGSRIRHGELRAGSRLFRAGRAAAPAIPWGFSGVKENP